MKRQEVQRRARLTRQEVADLAGLTYDVVRHNEQKLGLHQCRIEINQRLVYYDEVKVVGALIEIGILEAKPVVVLSGSNCH